LKIRFAFFSRTWRKRIVKFTGFSAHYDLVKGGGDLAVFSAGETVPAHLPTSDNKPDTVGTTTNVSSGATPAGLAEAQVPLMVLALPPGPPSTVTDIQAFDSSQVEQVSYDALCCSKIGETCQPGFAGRPQCCPGSQCDAPAASGGVTPTGTCVAVCKNVDEKCSSSADCCSSMVCGSKGFCRQCSGSNAPCGTDADCCTNYKCNKDNLCEQVVR
jgi:hypothetical protein